MVVREIRRNSSPQGSFAEENHPVETLGLHGKNESLGVRVLCLCSQRSPQKARSPGQEPPRPSSLIYV